MAYFFAIRKRGCGASGRFLRAGFLLGLVLLPSVVMAAEEGGTTTTEEVPRLPVVEVVAPPAGNDTAVSADPVTGKSVLKAETIQTLPAGNGNVSDLLRLLPGVQFSDQVDSSKTAGEIRPSLLSISGGKVYQNNFRIDGIGNNSLLDPTADSPTATNDVPGHPQAVFLNSRLVDEVAVYDSNVPARYGGFTGGVVDVSIRDPKEVFALAAYGRTTRHEWTDFHIADDERAAFEASNSETQQPRFRKYDAGLEVDIPLAPRTDLLAAYNALYSRIPLYLFGALEDQSRRTENYLLKLVHRPTPAQKFTLELLHSPYRGDHFIKDTQRSGYVIRGGGSSLSGKYLLRRGQGHLELHGALSRSENSREAPAEFFNWANSPSKDWGSQVGLSSSREGGFGDIRKTQRTLEFGVDWLSDLLNVGPWGHQFNGGVEWAQTRAKFDRRETSYNYATAKLDSTVTCDPADPACLDGEQWLSRRNSYSAESVSAAISQLALYLEDRQRLGRLEVRPAVRFSYDDFMENTDLAPRLGLGYDLFGTGTSVLVGGWNRYYGQTLLTYKLREAIPPAVTETRVLNGTTPGPWTLKPSTIPPLATSYSSLKTPYQDEIVAGLDQKVAGGTAKFRYLHRNGYDEFARQTDPYDPANPGAQRFARLNNNGRSHYESYGLEWARKWTSQELVINASYQKSTTTNETYDDTLSADDLTGLVYFEGELLHIDELPRKDFNRNWVGNLVYSVDLPRRFQFTNVTRYRSGYRALGDSGSDINIDGIDFPVYGEIKFPSATVFDWKLAWLSPPWQGQTLKLTLEVYNVFNRRLHLGSADNDFELGRQFWAGAEYAF